MDRHTFQGKRKIGVTDINDFTDFQGIGRDPLYKRFASVKSIIDNIIDPEYRDFLAIPDYDPSNGTIKWYVNDWEEMPVRFDELSPARKTGYEQIKNDTLTHYREKLDNLSGEDLRVMAGVLRYINDEFIYCADGKVYAIAWGMTPDKDKHIAMGELIHESPEPPEPEPSSPEAAAVPPVPPVNPNPVPPPGPRMANVYFDAGMGGVINGTTVLTKPIGSMITPEEIPMVSPNKGYTFTGWDFNPLNSIVNGDMTFQATYKAPKTRPWWWWLLLAIPLLLLLLLLLFFLFGFKGCRRTVNGIGELPVAVTALGDTIDNNGVVKPIELKDGKLPADSVITAPVTIDEDGTVPTIVREPGLPSVLGDRLILFIEDENDTVDALADAFKQAYPGDEYSIIGFDRYVKSLVIRVPENQRETVKNEIASKIPNHKFIVFDESIYELTSENSAGGAAARGWHLDAVNAQKAWQVTKGARSVKVAVVDDGLDRNHSMFKDRVVDPYNVFTRNNNLSAGVGHGTMVAGLAVGSLENVGQGAAGIAPDCSLMPVQVADNNIIPLSAIVSGIMYAVHQDADVVNVSIGPQLQGLNVLPFNDQVEISRTQFLNVARLWARVCTVADKNHSILVFAAGNDDILSSIPPENRAKSCIVVGAVDQRLYPTDFTNYGYCTDISAPGSDIYSSFPVNSFSSLDGTSFSAPIVTGAVALMRTLDKNVTVEQAKNVMYRTGKTVYGFMPPMLQIPEALEGIKNKDYSRGPDRQLVPVPVSADGSAGDSPESWVVPGRDGTIVDASGNVIPVEIGTLPTETAVIVPGSGGVVTPGGTVIGDGTAIGDGTVIGDRTIPGVDPNVPVTGSPSPSSPSTPISPGTPAEDYSYIRERIRQLEQEIRTLKQQLPENNRR